MSKQVDAIGFLGHSFVFKDPTSGNFISIGLCFAGNDGSLNCTIPSSYVGKVSPGRPGDTLTVTDSFSANSKVVFVGICYVGQDFESLWSIKPTTQGQALIVPDVSKFSGEVNLADAAVAWITIIHTLATGSTVQAAVNQANASMQTQNDPERWTFIGDGSVTIAKKPSN